MTPRFQSVNATPPGGFYEYEANGERVTSRNRFEICRLVRNLRTKFGMDVIGDGMRYVMEYMCPRLPDGFCTQPSSVKRVRADTAKKNTALLFHSRLAAADVIEKRMEVCVGCPEHTRVGFCVDCMGLLEWMYRGFGGRRGPLPADRALGACLCDDVMAAAGASVASRARKPDAKYPPCCWRLTETEAADAGNT